MNGSNGKRAENQGTWIVERVDHPRFPFRLRIVKNNHTLLALRVSDRWPGGSGNIFCLPEAGRDWPPPTEEIERVPVISLRRFGKRLSIVLDRPNRKRCDFLFLKKRYKHKEGEYEQIFWQTQTGMKQRRPRARFTAYGSTALHIAIDTRERYPWRFAGCEVERRLLPVGDYALLSDDEIIAVVERKTFANLLRDLTDLRILHQRLGELAAYPRAALVIEAEYADFLNPEKSRPLGASYCARALAELTLLHSQLPMIFAGTRKLANAWTRAFFTAVSAYSTNSSLSQVREAAAGYGRPALVRGGLDLQIRRAIRDEFPQEFSFQMLRDNFPDVSDSRLRRVLYQMRDRGEVCCRGRGRAARWAKQA